MELANLIFDFDGVIADSQDLYDEAIFQALKEAGFNYTRDQIRENTDRQYFETIEVMAKDKAEPALRYLEEHLIKRMRSGDLLFENAGEYLNKLSKVYRIFIVSNSPQKFLEECIKFYRLSVGEAVGRSGKFTGKKAAMEFLINKYQMKNSQTAYVGDSAGDVDLARSLGLSAFSVASGWDSEAKLKKNKPDRLYKNFRELTKDLIK